MRRIGTHTSVFLAVLLLISLQCAAAQGTQTNWIGSWSSASFGMNTSGTGQSMGNFTYRNVVRVSVGGTSLRVQLTNEFGATALSVGAAQVALSAGSGAIQPGTNVPLTFGGSPTVTIPAGGAAYSDPLTFTVPALSSLAVSVYIPAQTISHASCHPYPLANNYQSTGNTVAQASGGSVVLNWCYLRGIDVANGSVGSSIVALGDSITDGYNSPVDGNKRYTDFLAANLQANSATANIGVLNKGIVGNELLGEDSFDGYGPDGMARLPIDVFSQTNVSYLIVLEGINDIGYSSGSVATADALIASYQQLIVQAHDHGLWVYGCTLPPDWGNTYYPANNDVARQTVNAWIRNSGAFDAVIDFDAVLSNGAVAPAIPALQTQYDSGDHLHPNAAGYQAMANAINLSLFENAQTVTRKR